MRRALPLFLAVLLAPSAAHAAEPDPVPVPVPVPAPVPPAPSRLTQTRWYGWQTLAVDAAGLGLSIPAKVASPFVVASIIGAPAVHFAHGHPVRALVDFGLRVAIPLGLGLVLAGPYDPAPNDASAKLQQFSIGAVIGASVVSLFDAGFLGRDEVEVERKAAIQLTPTGVAGRF